MGASVRPTGRSDAERQRIAAYVNRMRSQGASDEEVRAFVTHAETNGLDAPESTGDYAAGLARTTLGQGLAAGFGDEIEGAGASLLAVARGEAPIDAYRKQRDAARASVAQFGTRHLKTAAASELVGGLAGAAVPIGTAVRAVGTGAKIARAAKVGATFGGITGLGKGEGDLASQAKSTAAGALAGGTLGGALQAAGSGVQAAARLRAASGEDRAAQLIQRVIARSGTPTAPAPGMTFADVVGRPAQNLLDYAVSVPSQGGTEAAEFLANRAAARPGRLQQGVEEALGAARGNVVADDAAMRAARSEAARTNYGAAYQETVPVDVFADIANVSIPTRGMHGPGEANPFAAAYEAGRGLATIDGVRLPPWSAVVEGMTAPPGAAKSLRQVPVQALDYMKRGMDKIIQPGTESQFAIDRTGARALGNRLRDLLAAADQHAPAFATARRQFADESELIDALEAGQSALREKPQAITDAIDAFTSDPVRGRYRQGIAEDVATRITGRDVLGTRSLRALQQPNAQDALAAAAPDAPRALALRRLLANEGVMQETEATALRNSATARRLMQARDAEGVGAEEVAEMGRAGLSAIGGNLGPALGMLGRRASARLVQGINERTSDALSRMLLAGRNDPQEIAQLLQALVAFQARRSAPLPSRAVAGRVGGRASGLLLGRGER